MRVKRRVVACCTPITRYMPSWWHHSRWCPKSPEKPVLDSEWIVRYVDEPSAGQQDHERAVVLDVCMYCGESAGLHCEWCTTNPYASPEVEDRYRRVMTALHPELKSIPGYSAKREGTDAL